MPEECIDKVAPPSAPSPVDIIVEWIKTGAIGDAARTNPLVVPIMIGNYTPAWIYIMPPGAMQQASRHPWIYFAGRVVQGVGIALDVMEMILTAVPEHSPAAWAGILDAGITLGGAWMTGEAYFFESIPGLPPMISVNQDIAVNALEAAIGGLAPYALGVLGAGSTGTLAGLGGGYTSGKIVDALTSGASALYDAARFQGYWRNKFMLGISNEGIILVYWP